MKMSIKHEFFEKIKKGKSLEIREAHLTFIDEKTKELLRKEVTGCEVMPKDVFSDFDKARISRKRFNNMFKENRIIVFELK